MYTTTTATREQVLKAVAAARRAMERHVCSKSQFKFKCFSCGKMIHRGDKITRCVKADAGMTLRYRGAGGECGLTVAETAFYQAETGKDMWVHIGCNPCYWDEGFDNGDESSPPALRTIPTEWGSKISCEFLEWTHGPGGEAWITMGESYFLMVKGYPKEKFMKDRIVNAVTRFQALWRGYIYKKAYPIARLDAIATRILNEAGLQDDCNRQQACWEGEWQQSLAHSLAHSHARDNWLQSGEGLSGQEVPDLITKRQREAEREAERNKRARNGFLYNNSLGGHVEILFDERRSSAAIYSGEIIKIQGVPEIDGLYYWVKFHHDGEVRRYHWKRLLDLKLECKTFKSKHGIQAEIKGKICVYCFTHPVSVYKKQKIKKK